MEANPFEPEMLAWSAGWLVTMAIGTAIACAQREWFFALTQLPETERKSIYAVGIAGILFLGSLPGYFMWPAFFAVEVGWLLHPLLRPWLTGK